MRAQVLVPAGKQSFTSRGRLTRRTEAAAIVVALLAFAPQAGAEPSESSAAFAELRCAWMHPVYGYAGVGKGLSTGARLGLFPWSSIPVAMTAGFDVSCADHLSCWQEWRERCPLHSNCHTPHHARCRWARWIADRGLTRQQGALRLRGDRRCRADVSVRCSGGRGAGGRDVLIRPKLRPRPWSKSLGDHGYGRTHRSSSLVTREAGPRRATSPERVAKLCHDAP